MQAIQEIKLLGKRNSESSTSGKLSMTEKTKPLDIQNKILKSRRTKTIFSKSKEYCNCSGKKCCDKPYLKKKKKNSLQKEI